MNQPVLLLQDKVDSNGSDRQKLEKIKELLKSLLPGQRIKLA
jgi:hypothetical protein